jgi:bacteriocin-like protein
MDATTIALEIKAEISEDELFLDLETLTDEELAKIGGGQGIIVLD